MARRPAAAAAPPAPKPAAPRSALRENFEAIALAALFALFVRTFIAQPYKIPSGSMEENLLIGDHLVVNKILLGSAPGPDGFTPFCQRAPRRGDVVIFRPPNGDESDYIKRVIGLPGETLTLAYTPARNGVRVSINGTPLAENYELAKGGPVTEEPNALWTCLYDRLRQPPEADTLRHPDWMIRTVHLGPDEYWMMGDNRNNSEDSRFWGPVKAERLRGRAWFVYWSFDTKDLPPEARNLGEQVHLYLHILLRFLADSRWSRTLHLIR